MTTDVIVARDDKILRVVSRELRSPCPTRANTARAGGA